MTLRIDAVGRLDAKKRTPQGGLRVDANLTRTGVFTYRNPDGSEVREYRSPEEVFKADALETFKLAPVVVGHPAMVQPGNFKQHSVGVVAEDVRQNGKFVTASLVIQDADTINKIEAGVLSEVSLGYEVDLVHEPGISPEGEKYDARQVNIRGNHAGLGSRGWGRAGSEVCLRLDGNGDALPIELPTLDGMTLEEMKARAEKAEAELKTANARADKAEGERDAERTRADKADADLKKARTDAAALDIAGMVLARTLLEASARKVLGADAKLTVKADGKDERPMTDAEVIIAVIAKDDATFKVDGKSVDYLQARFDTIVERTAKADDALRSVGDAVTDATRTGGTPEESPLDKAIAKRDADNREAAKAGPPKGALVKA